VSRNFVSTKTQQHRDGRDELDRTVNEMCRRVSTPKRHVTYRLNEVTGQLVEVR
jgi:uncharacterized FlaG/YvyC family protein